MTDILGSVLLTPTVYRAWMAQAAQVALQLISQGVHPAAIPDEQAEVTNDGRLRLFVQMASGEVLCELFVPAEHWRWMDA